MRGSSIGALAGLIASFALAGQASASASIALIWERSETASTTLAASSAATLNIVLTAGPLGARSAGVTVDYGDAAGALSVIGIVNNPTMPSPTSMLPLIVGQTRDTGSRVENVTAEVFPPFVRTGLMSGQTWLLGTVTFATTRVSTGEFSISSMTTGSGDILSLAGNSISGGSTFNSAVLNVIPEPGTVALVGLGLLGLAIVGRQAGQHRG